MPLDPQLLRQLIQNDPSITELDLSDQKLTREDIKQLVQALETNNKVVKIDLNNNPIGDEGAILLAQLEDVHQLEVVNCNIGPRGAAALAAGKFTSLGLRGNHIHDEGAIALATQSATLTSLDISTNRITDRAMTALGDNAHLTTLVMHGNHVTDAGAIEFAKRNKQVEYLHLFSNQIGDAGAAALAKHPQVKTLFLGWNKLTDKGALAFKNNAVLEELDIRRNPISPETIQTLSQSKTLECLRYNNSEYILLKGKQAAQETPAAKNNGEKRAADSQVSKPITRSSNKKQAVATPQAQDRPSPNKLSPG